MVTESHVNALMVTQPVGRVVAADVQSGYVDDDVQRVKVMRGLGAPEFVVQSGLGLYPTPEVSGEGERGVKLVMAVLDHLTPPPVQRPRTSSRSGW